MHSMGTGSVWLLSVAPSLYPSVAMIPKDSLLHP
jgi:hypothetical protein